MIQKILASLACILAFTGASTAAMAASKPTKMTCNDFIQLDEISRPRLVYWFDGFDRKGNPEETIDFARNDSLIPVLVEECTKNPTNLLATKFKAVKKNTAKN